MAIVKTPFSNHFGSRNPKSIKPTNYEGYYIINMCYNFASKKGKDPKVVGLVDLRLSDKQKCSNTIKLQILFNHSQMYFFLNN